MAGIPDFRDSVVAFAMDQEGRTYLLHVPGVANASLGDEEISAVLNFVIDQWGEAPTQLRVPHFTPQETAKRRAVPIGDVVLFRRHIVGRLGNDRIRATGYPWP